MGLFGWLGIIFVIFVIFGIIANATEQRKMAAMTPEQRAKYEAKKKAQSAELRRTLEHGALNAAMVCPHCQTKGSVRTKAVDRKKGVSGGKATAALLTGGFSMLATGLSRKEHFTQAYCENCENSWEF